MAVKTLASYRKEFPVCERHIYLDHAGIAPVSQRVAAAAAGYAQESSREGAFAYPAWVERTSVVRNDCARLIRAVPEEIAFVKSTSHGLSIIAEGLDWRAGDNVLYFEGDFPSNIYPWLRLGELGVEPRPLRARGGRIEIADIVQRMDKRTRLLSVSSVQFTNGFRLDLERTGKLCSERGVLFCVDAIQSLGILPMDVRSYHIDFLAADAHKWLLGPEGVGIFYCGKELSEKVRPPLIGWKSVEKDLDFDHPDLRLKTSALRFEEGSLNLMGIFGLGAAVSMLLEIGIERIGQRVQDLGTVVIEEAEKRGCAVITPKDRTERGGGVTFRGGFDPAAVRESLRLQGTMVNVRGGGIRVSPHFYNTEEELSEFFRQLDGVRRA